VLALPDGDRLEFVEAMLASLPDENRPPFDESWREFIQRRSAELRSGKVTPVPWAQVKDPDGLARQEAERLASQMDWDRLVEAFRPPQKWFDGDEPKVF
jgi:putative addiction module component (TIGR02574 family)